MKYFYWDYDKRNVKKQRYTCAPFIGWTEPGGLLNARYAMFARKSETLLIPQYLLTKETRALLSTPESTTPIVRRKPHRKEQTP